MASAGSARPSVGGRLAGKPAAAPKDVYSFPVLPLNEIVEVLHELGVVVSEDDLQKPKPDSFRQWCELFVMEILSISKEEIYTPQKSCTPFLNGNDDIYDEAVPVVHFLRKTNKVLLAARCDEGLSLRDIMKPEKQRVQRVLSALINLFKFRAEKLAWYEENIEKKAASVARKQDLLAQIENLKALIEAEKRAREAEQPEIQSLQAQSRVLEVQRDELQRKMDGVKMKTEGQKEEIRGLKEQAAGVHKAADEVQRALEERQSQIVSSPAKVKAEVASLVSIVEAGAEGCEAEKRVITRQLEVIAKANKDVKKARTLMGEAEAEAVKLKRVLREEKGRKAEAEALQGEVEGLRAALQHAETAKARVEEKLLQTKEDGASQVAAQARQLDAIRMEIAEYTDSAKNAGNARRAAENEKTRLEAKKENLIAKHTAEVSEILSSVKHLAGSVSHYHGSLFANLQAVNAMAPVGAGDSKGL